MRRRLSSKKSSAGTDRTVTRRSGVTLVSPDSGPDTWEPLVKSVERELLRVRLRGATLIDDPTEKEKHVERIAREIERVRAQMP